MLSSDLDYPLPESLIATEPVEPRDAARLMVVRRDASGTGEAAIEHRIVRELPELLRRGDLMVVNRSRVLPASFTARRAATGGRVGGLFIQEAGPRRWVVMLESRGSPRPGERIVLDPEHELELLERLEAGTWSAELHGPLDTLALLGRIGQTPLPPYILKARRRHGLAQRRADDPGRYNTIYAADPGSIAAPTAGLHFTGQLLERLEAAGIERAAVSLHVGPGTFLPVRTERLEAHAMHREQVSIPARTLAALRSARERGGRIVCIGTTTVRALESLPEHWPSLADRGWEGATELFIHPEAGFTFRFTDVLLTNFHLPRSTLLAMVATLPGVGLPRLKRWYAEAVERRYRFYSYGDAMLLL